MQLIYKLLIFQFIIFNALAAQPISEKYDDSIYISERSNEIECERAVIIEDYQNDFVGTNVSSMELDWNGNIDACEAGQISPLAMERTLRRINYFRHLVGLESEIIFSELKNKKSQKAVLMMDAENKLDHFPTVDWQCSSPEGIEAAGKSNLSYGGHSSASVPQYIRDAGSGNGAVGHRRWILYPKSHEFGFGSTNWGTAMWVIGGTKNPEYYPEFVAYPSPGYFPKNLIYPRWSFSKKGANFSAAKLRISNEAGEQIEYEQEEVTNGYGDHTIVWVPSINVNDSSLGSDFYVKVEIDSVKTGGNYENFAYEVLAITPELHEDQFFLEMPTCSLANGSISMIIPTGYKQISWSNGVENEETLNGLRAGIYSATITDKIGCEKTLEFELVDTHLAAILSTLSGNQTSVANQTETYFTDQHADGSYSWTITNGKIVSQDSDYLVEVVWDEGVSLGMICTHFSDNRGCKSDEICLDVELTTSGIESHLVRKPSIFPNPVAHVLYLSFASPVEDTEVLIYNSNGARVKKIDLVKNTEDIVINVESLSAGLYFLRTTIQGKPIIQKFIKN